MHNQKTNIIAIDPGASGGIAEMREEKFYANPMPDDVELTSILSEYARNFGQTFPAVVYMEQVGGFIKGNPAPGSAMFNFGDGFGFIRGLCAGLGLKLVLVRPQLWQKGIAYAGAAKDKAERKRAYKEHAARLFPGIVPTLKTADALCLLDYARRAEGMQPTEALPVATNQDWPPHVNKPRRGARYSEAQAAISWCKVNGWEPPLTGTADFNKMLVCYRERPNRTV